jgi:hypothetical protein
VPVARCSAVRQFVQATSGTPGRTDVQSPLQPRYPPLPPGPGAWASTNLLGSLRVFSTFWLSGNTILPGPPTLYELNVPSAPSDTELVALALAPSPSAVAMMPLAEVIVPRPWPLPPMISPHAPWVVTVSALAERPDGSFTVGGS